MVSVVFFSFTALPVSFLFPVPYFSGKIICKGERDYALSSIVHTVAACAASQGVRAAHIRRAVIKHFSPFLFSILLRTQSSVISVVDGDHCVILPIAKNTI